MANINVGVSFSAGIDSTVLAYEIMNKHFDDNIYFMTIKKQRAEQFAPKVIKLLEKRVSKNVIWIQVENLELGQYPQIYEREIKKNNLTYMYAGTNKIPQWLLDKGHSQRIDWRNEIIKMPYFELSKVDILKKAEDYQIEDILKYTYSCNNSLIPPCGECFGCIENEQARLDKKTF